MSESKSRLSIVLSSVLKFAAFGIMVGTIKSGYVAVKVGSGVGAFLMAPAIGAAFFGFIGLIAGIAKAGIHKTRAEKVANKEMGYLGQLIAAIILFGIIALLSR